MSGRSLNELPFEDWAYLEDWCRRLTGSFQDVYIFTVPLYVPKQENDGKWRVVSSFTCFFYQHVTNVAMFQTHEVIGSPPNIAVPTHFAKVVLTSKPASPTTPDAAEISTGAFILPNAAITDHAPLKSFSVPGKCLSLLRLRSPL